MPENRIAQFLDEVAPPRAGCVQVERQQVAQGWEQHLQTALSKLVAEISFSARLGQVESRLSLVEASLSPIVMSVLDSGQLELVKPIHVAIQCNGDDCIASFFDANINASGETPQEAFANLRDMVVSTFMLYSSLDSSELGIGPTRQLAVLRQFIRRK